jgi:hypothetical protein
VNAGSPKPALISARISRSRAARRPPKGERDQVEQRGADMINQRGIVFESIWPEQDKRRGPREKGPDVGRQVIGIGRIMYVIKPQQNIPGICGVN